LSKTRIENSEKSDRDAEALFRAIEALKRGEVIVFPTETFYGLGADAFNEAAVQRVVSLKGRDPENPVPIIIADEEMLKDVVAGVPHVAQRLIDRFWPGPLTLVLPAQKNLPAPLLNRDGGVGIRISGHPLATELAHELGHPLTATSANPSGKSPAQTIEEARSYFSGKIEIFIDGGRLRGKRGSTVVEVRKDRIKIIREGEIPLRQLEEQIGSIVVS
jgi:L-threonylcarbamoyladenylate synthase